MYTKCPSCRSEISFEPPANMESLPDGYKHRIKCPSCGVTIGVKIPKQESNVEVVKPANEFAVTPDSVIPTGTPVEEQTDTKAKKNKKVKAAKGEKKSGIVRNIFILLFSALVIAINVLAYLNVKIPFCDGFEKYNGIVVFQQLIEKDPALYSVLTFKTFITGILALMPAGLFVLSGISFIVAFIAACGKKYSRAFNFIWGLFIAAAAILILLAPVINKEVGILDYFVNDVIGGKLYGLLIAAGIGFLHFIFSLFFLASMKKKSK